MRSTGTARSFLGFIVVGAINTLVGYLLYLLLLRAMGYRLAYTLAYLVGIGLSYYLNTRWVFRQPVSLCKFLQYPVVYVAQYVFGVLCLSLLVNLAHLPAEFGPPIVVALSIPLTYSLSRFVITR